ncbi:MAG TPA: heme A synthase [Flavobacteriales bacterium]|jgi:cytochrome c oxidase assembly protein subunit 15|nr:heme A synthase [Flavobacteriales bacterium]
MQKVRPVAIWLFIGAFLVFLTTAIGGITRLTDSGLSMVDWNLIMGSVPPLSEEEWHESFEEYQKYPEFQAIHSHFTLTDFKRIFFWEYLHRMMGRFIGLVFIIPFIIFLIQRRISRPLFFKLMILFGLGAFQAFLGWFMVKSGLADQPRVSHFRLAAHLITAFITASYSFNLGLQLWNGTKKKLLISPGISRLVVFSFIILIVQIIYGAFVAGKDAGLVHNYWPHMNPGVLVAPQAFEMNPFYLNLVENNSGIQFIHRYIGITLFLIILTLWFRTRKSGNSSLIRRINYMLVMVFVQFALGVTTLIFHLPLFLAVLHQLGALILLLMHVEFVSNTTTSFRNKSGLTINPPEALG